MASKNDNMITRPDCSALDLSKDPDADKIQGVRLYRSSPGRVTLQIRSVGSTNQLRGGVPKHIVSSADMDVQSARQLVVWLQRFVEGGDF